MPKTRESLLMRLHDASDSAAWNEFVQLYRPIVYRLARRGGMQDSDAEDLAQRVMLSVSRAISQWKKDPTQGTFSAWLSRVTRNAMINLATRRPNDVSLGGSDFLDLCQQLPEASHDVEMLIQAEHTRSVLRIAAAQIKNEFEWTTWNAFWRTTIEQEPIKDVAKQLGVSTGVVYGARSRVMKRLQAVASDLNDEEWRV